MTVYNLKTIDGTALDPATGEVVLLIEDNLNWNDEALHLSILEQKLNRYFQFVQSGQLAEHYPDATKRGTRIDCICQEAAPASVNWFAEEVNKSSSQIDIVFAFKAMPQDVAK